MKKVLVSLLVLALAVSGAFAAVNFNGVFEAGYTFNKPNNGDWTIGAWGNDNIYSSPVKLNANISDDTGVWSGTLKGELVADSRLEGSVTVDFGKLFLGEDSDFAIKVGATANGRVAGLNAFNNASGLNISRIRTNEKGLWFSLNVAYTDLVEVQVAGGPTLFADPASESAEWATDKGDFLASAIVRPLDGLAVSLGYVLNGETKMIYTKDGGEGALNAAVDANIGKLAGLDFDLGVSAAYKIGFGAEYNAVMAAVYGGVDVVDVAIEYGLGIPKTGELKNVLYAGVDLNVVENLILNVYGGSTDFAVKDSYYVGANVGYTVSGITLNANLQYAGAGAGMGDIGGDIGEGAVKANGFSITPSISVAW